MHPEHAGSPAFDRADQYASRKRSPYNQADECHSQPLNRSRVEAPINPGGPTVAITA